MNNRKPMRNQSYKDSPGRTNLINSQRNIFFSALIIIILYLLISLYTGKYDSEGIKLDLDYDHEKINKEESNSKPTNEIQEANGDKGYFTKKLFFPDVTRFNVKPSSKDDRVFIIKDAQGVTIYDTKTNDTSSIPLYDLVPDLELGEYIMVKNLVIFSTGEGIGIYNIDSKKVQLYGTEDGLVDQSNIRFSPDPYEDNIVWIGTFRGLSKFDLESRTFVSYKKGFGISGKVWQPVVFYIDQNTVWTAIGSNVHSSGGIARLDKSTGTWTGWGTETFVVDGIPNSTVDPAYTRLGSNNNIIIEDEKTEYIFDRNSQSWSILNTIEVTPIVRGLNLEDNWYYYKGGDEVIARDLNSKDTKSLNYQELFNKTAGTKLSSFDVSYDKSHGRYLVRPVDSLFAENPYILSIYISKGVREKIELFTFKDILSQFEYTNVEILDVYENQMAVKTSNSIVLYDLNSNQQILEIVEDDFLFKGFSVEAKLYSDTIVVHATESCEAYCSDNATTTMWNKVTGDLKLADYFDPSDTNFLSGWTPVWNKDVPGLTLKNGYADDAPAYSITEESGKYQESSDIPESDEKFAKYGEFVSANHPNNVWYVKNATDLYPDTLNIKSVNPDGEEEITHIDLPVKVSPFGGYSRYSVSDIAWDGDVLWLLTYRGLVKFNTESKNWSIYDSNDGLIQDGGGKLYIYDDKFIISNNLGSIVYQYIEKIN